MEIRPVREEDAAAFLTLQLHLDEETHFMMLEPGERRTSMEDTRRRIRAMLDQPNALLLVVDAGEAGLAGYLCAEGGEFRRNWLSAYITCGVLQAFAGQGLGRRLFEQLEEWARACGMRRLELTVMTHNQRAVALYRRMGFIIEGVRKDSLRVDGQFVDEYAMAKILTA